MSARRVAAVLVGGLIVVACSGEDLPDESDGVPPEAAAPDPDGGAGEADGGDTFVASDGRDADDGTADPATPDDAASTASPVATIGDPTRHPLTGVEVDGSENPRPALAVVVDNAEGADGLQEGLGQADIVVETIVEGGVTRLLAVFHSNEAARIGPVRSTRTQDLPILSALGTPLVASAGGNPGVTELFTGTSAVVDIGFQDHPDAYESTDAPGPHNLVTSGGALRSVATDVDPGAPSPQFVFVGPNMEPAGDPVGGFELTMGATLVGWTWDAVTGTFVRTQRGTAHLAADGTQMSAENVVVLGTFSRPSAVDERSPEAQTLGNASVYVFAAGEVLVGKWWRRDATAPFLLTDVDGDPLPLMPGRTWIELAEMDLDPAEGEPPLPITIFGG